MTVFVIPPHVVLLRELLASARPIYGHPDRLSPTVGWAVRPARTPFEFDAYVALKRRGLLEDCTVAVPGEAHPFEEAIATVLTEAAHELLRQYTPAPVATLTLTDIPPSED